MVPVIHFKTYINEQNIEKLLVALKSVNAPNTVLIDSPGGTFDFFSSRAPSIVRRGITTIANKVYSAATVLFVLGAERLVHRDSELLFHEVRAISRDGTHVTVTDMRGYHAYLFEMSNRLELEMVEELYHQMHYAQEWLIQFIADHTHCPKEIVRTLIQNDITLSGTEAYHYGIATRLVSIRAW